MKQFRVVVDQAMAEEEYRYNAGEFEASYAFDVPRWVHPGRPLDQVVLRRPNKSFVNNNRDTTTFNIKCTALRLMSPVLVAEIYSNPGAGVIGAI